MNEGRMLAVELRANNADHGDVEWIGLHKYVFDSACRLSDDGCTVLCPTVLTAEGQATLSPGQQLPSNLVFGSVVVAFDGYSWTDWQLHGHTGNVIGNNPPNINHEIGTITTPHVPDQYATVTYRRATSPGRWVKQFSAGEPFPLSMLGVPDNDVNNYEAICWALLIASRIKRQLLIDGEYWHWGGCIELPHAIVVRGTDGAAIRLNQNRVMERFRQDLGNLTPRWGVDKPYFAGYAAPVWMHKPDCKQFTIENLELDGGAFAWEGWTNGEFDDPTKFDKALLSQAFRESPTNGGLWPHNQNNRPYAGLRITVRDSHIHSFMASCITSVRTAEWDTQNLTVGPTVSGRIFYGPNGRHTNLKTWGVSRTSVARNGSLQVDGWKYRAEGSVNPWLDNTVPVNICGMEGDSLDLHNIDWDFTSSPFHTAFSGHTRRLRASGTMRNCGMLWQYNENNPAAVTPVNATLDIQLLNTGNLKTQLFAANKAAISHVDAIIAHVVDGYVTPAPRPIDAATIRDWYDLHGLPISISVQRVLGSPARQYFRFQLDDPYHRLVLLQVRDLAPGGIVAADIVPTVIELSGVMHNSLANLISTSTGLTESSATSYAGAPVLIRCKDLTFDFPGGGPFIGDRFPRQQLELMSFENCRTHAGRVSEDGGTVDVPAGGITIPTRLFTWPINTEIHSNGDSKVSYAWSGTETAPTLTLTPVACPVTVTWHADFKRAV